jgi:hypothetical protein
MPEFDYIVDLLEAKGWYLYEGIAHASLPQVISAGRARTVRLGVYYHLMPAISHDSSPEEMLAAASEAAKRKAMPTFNDGVNSGVVLGIHIGDGEFAFASQPNSFAFPAANRTSIEDAIKYNLSTYNTYFFSSIDEIGSFLEQRKITPQLPGVLPGQLRWNYVHLEDHPTTTAIWPENPGDVLFRGQVKRYVPCVSTAARGLGIEARLMHELSEAHQARLIVNFVKAEWFTSVLRETSAVNWLKESHVFLDPMAVAQHYGLPTGYIDLTQSFEVASFFACCRYDPVTKAWTPAAEGEGVVYALYWRAVASECAIRPINLQFFPRPSEQWGWTCELRLGDDFDKLPFVRKFIFKHDAQASARILAKFAQGAALFPPDPLSDLADLIVASPVLPMDTAVRIAQDVIDDAQGKPGATVDEVLSLLRDFGDVTLSSDVSIPDLSRIQSEMDTVWQQKKGSFFQGIGFRLTRTRKE